MVREEAMFILRSAFFFFFFTNLKLVCVFFVCETKAKLCHNAVNLLSRFRCAHFQGPINTVELI